MLHQVLYCLVPLNSVLFKPCLFRFFVTPVVEHWLAGTKNSFMGPPRIDLMTYCTMNKHYNGAMSCSYIHIDPHTYMQTHVHIQGSITASLCSYFPQSFQPVLHDLLQRLWYVLSFCGMMHIKEPLLLIGRNSPMWRHWVSSLTIRLGLYHMSFTIECVVKYKNPFFIFHNSISDTNILFEQSVNVAVKFLNNCQLSSNLVL